MRLTSNCCSSAASFIQTCLKQIFLCQILNYITNVGFDISCSCATARLSYVAHSVNDVPACVCRHASVDDIAHRQIYAASFRKIRKLGVNFNLSGLINLRVDVIKRNASSVIHHVVEFRIISIKFVKLTGLSCGSDAIEQSLRRFRCINAAIILARLIHWVGIFSTYLSKKFIFR